MQNISKSCRRSVQLIPGESCESVRKKFGLQVPDVSPEDQEGMAFAVLFLTVQKALQNRFERSGKASEFHPSRMSAHGFRNIQEYIGAREPKEGLALKVLDHILQSGEKVEGPFYAHAQNVALKVANRHFPRPKQSNPNHGWVTVLNTPM